MARPANPTRSRRGCARSSKGRSHAPSLSWRPAGASGTPREPTAHRRTGQGIIELLMDLRRSEGLAMSFITHDLALVSSIASRTIVLQRGAIVEQGLTAQVLDHPSHAYTRALLRHHEATQGRGTR